MEHRVNQVIKLYLFSNEIMKLLYRHGTWRNSYMLKAAYKP